MAQASQARGQQRSAAQRVGQIRLMVFDMRAPNTKAIVCAGGVSGREEGRGGAGERGRSVEAARRAREEELRGRRRKV